MKKQAHVSQAKKDTVAHLIKLIEHEKIVGIINMQDLPAAQLQVMRKRLKGKVSMYMTKKRLIKIAIEHVKAKKPGFEHLLKYLDGMPALLFTKDNPFSLYKTIKKSKSPAPAKAGQKAPRDILIQKGPTPFAPGPVISELTAIGLKPGVEGGKVAIKEDKVVVKEGEEIKANLASLLLRLGITPMEIGLNLVAVYEEGTVYDKKVLDVDDTVIMKQIEQAASESFNLAMEISFPTKDTIETLIGLAGLQAKTLSVEQGILTKETAEAILAKAEAQATALKNETKL